MLQTILLVILILVSVALIAVILLQRSEGGALGMGGGPSGFMSTRGVGDLLTRTTSILAGVFFLLCIGLTLIIGHAHKGDAVVDRFKIQGRDPASLARPQTPPPGNTTAPAPVAGQPLLLEAPKPEVHAAPSAGAPTPLLVPTPTAKPTANFVRTPAAPPAAAPATPAPANAPAP